MTRVLRPPVLRSPLFWASAVAAAAIVAGGAAAYSNTLALTESAGWVAHTLQVEAQLAEALAVLKDAEGGQRGYLLTGREEYVEPYRTAVDELPGRLFHLQTLTADNPAQQARIQALRSLAATKMGELKRSIELRRAGAPDAAALLEDGHGERVMDEARRVVAAMRAEEDRLLAEREREVAAAAQRTKVFLTASTALVLALLTAVYLTGHWAAARVEQSATRLSQDIRNREQAEAEVRRLAAELEQRVEERTAALQEANSELESFAYTIAHDLRAPVRNMHSLADALSEDCGEELSPDGQEYTRRIVAAAVRMDTLIQDLLAYARLSREALSPQPVDLDEVVGDVLSQVQGELSERGAVVRVERPLGRVLAHRPTVGQVITNLVGNALKFVDRQKVPEVRIHSERRGPCVRLWVEDRGIGVAPEHRERIFRVFERLHGQEAYPGTGIGLAIVRKGAERMGGSAGVESEPGQGSQFWIELRRAEAA
jgi:signal transduction histidine kinase